MVSDANDSSLQLVEMCSSEGVWSPACDYDWTLKDAMVVCQELGYSSLAIYMSLNVQTLNDAGNMKVLDAVEGSSDMIPICSGTETRLISCLSPVPQTTKCDYLLVECRDPLSMGGNIIAPHIIQKNIPLILEATKESGGVPIAVIAGTAVMTIVLALLALLFIVAFTFKMKKYRSGNVKRYNCINVVNNLMILPKIIIGQLSKDNFGLLTMFPVMEMYCMRPQGLEPVEMYTRLRTWRMESQRVLRCILCVCSPTLCITCTLSVHDTVKKWTMTMLS